MIGGVFYRSCEYGAIGSIRLLKSWCRPLHWLNALPASADAGHGIFACHGTPTNDNQHLIEEVAHDRSFAHPSTIRERLGDVQARVVLCGHSHQQHLIRLPDGPLILNSVASAARLMPIQVPNLTCPKAAHPTQDALFSALTSKTCRQSMIALAYDWKAASAQAERNDRPEWAYGLRTGWFISWSQCFLTFGQYAARLCAPSALQPCQPALRRPSCTCSRSSGRSSRRSSSGSSMRVRKASPNNASPFGHHRVRIVHPSDLPQCSDQCVVGLTERGK